ncbi:MAG: hypothetical protein PHT33_02110 [bacterium]|nr:hypothetical protein [bacterium]
MMGIVHLLVGAALGSISGSKCEAGVAGFASHLVLDSLPHRDLDLKGEVMAALAAIVVLAPLIKLDARVLTGAAAAVAPDLENALWRFDIISKKDMRYPSHSGLTPHGPKVATMAGQVLIAVAALFLLRRRR